MTKPIEVWRCEECGTVHDDEDEANECCRPEITEGYQCGECGTFYVDEVDANNCCAQDGDGVGLCTNPLELEMAGQMRLLP